MTELEGVKSEGEYFLSGCIYEEHVITPMDWGLDENVPSNECFKEETGNLEYHSVDEKPFIKTENSISSDDSVVELEQNDTNFIKKEPVDYPSEYLIESEYDGGSDVSVKVYDPSNFFNGNTSSPESQMDHKPKIMTLRDWLQLPAEVYAQHCADVENRNQLETHSLTDDDSDSQRSSTEEQLSVQPPQSSKSRRDDIKRAIFPPRKTPEINADEDSLARRLASRYVGQQTDCRDHHKKRYRRSPDSSRATAEGVTRLRGATNRVGKRSRRLNKIAGNRGIGKNPKTRRQLNNPEEELWHDGRRITRGLIKSIENPPPNINGRDDIGKFVWGFCRGWWPAVIVAAEHGGLQAIADKVCVYWISEDLISQLNVKTQVEPFSTNLEIRLIRFLKDDGVGKDRKKASFVTLKLFSKYLGIPLLKPYVKWAQKYLVDKTHLNNLRFSPFPKNMVQRLEQLKEQNIKSLEKIAQQEARAARFSSESSSSKDQDPRNSSDMKSQDSGSQGKFPKDYVRKSTNNLLLESQDNQQILPLMNQKPGVIIWGKITGHSWWPAMMIHYHDCGKTEPNFGCQWILWYGDYQLSQVHYQNVMKFDEGIKKMTEYITQCKREKYLEAVLGACKDYCARLNYDTGNWTMDDVLAWISSSDENSEIPPNSRPDNGHLKTRYSPHIAEKLNEMKANQEIAAEREEMIENCDALKAVFAGMQETLKVLCIICLKIDRDLLEHPFFECAICKKCVEEIKATMFAYGDDGKCFFCTLCTGSDTIVMCSSLDCPRVYCTACLKYLICPSEYDDILIKEPWLCFVCENGKDANKNRIFKARSDWKTRIGQLFHTDQDTSWEKAWNNNEPKKKMRVLSLFDGIGTGLMVLEKLGIKMEVYYASEIDIDAQIVSAAYFGDRIIRLGDVRNIDEETIAEIAPIDLLIGGSPCNDLSLVNPNRLGLHDPKGTGALFFEYCRIKKLVIEANRGHHLFWLFENVASMPSEYRLEMNKYLECEPSLIDAADFSPQHRPRLFWGNLPSGVNFPVPDSSQDLQSVLTPNCKREAQVKKIRTVTTRANSLKQGVALLKPVSMNGVLDSLWITELEEIFGFPKHYTDVKNLSATRRQKLIGQAWSVQTVTALLLPLRYFFAVENRESFGSM